MQPDWSRNKLKQVILQGTGERSRGRKRDYQVTSARVWFEHSFKLRQIQIDLAHIGLCEVLLLVTDCAARILGNDVTTKVPPI
jgi:hypothetical protein